MNAHHQGHQAQQERVWGWGGLRVLVAVVVLALVLTAARQGDETARQILDRQRALEDGARHWSDRHQQLRMEVIDPRRERREMAVDLFDKRFPAREQRTMAYFSAPDAVKGTAFLAI